MFSSKASLTAQVVKNLPAMQKAQFDSWVGKIPWRRDKLLTPLFLDFPCSSAGKETTCNAGDPGLIFGMGRSAGEGISYSLHYSWASLVAQLIKNLPAMRETWVWSLGWEDSLEKGKATHFSILPWRIPCTGWSMAWRRVGHNWETFTFLKGVDL